MAVADGFSVSSELDGALFRLGQTLRRLRVSIGGDEGFAYAIGAGFWQLHHIHDFGEVRVSEMAAALNLDISTVSRQLKGLLNRGLVERIADPNDARVVLVRLSPLGRRIFAELVGKRRSLFDSALEGWPPQDLDNLVHLLERMVQDLDCAINEVDG